MPVVENSSIGWGCSNIAFTPAFWADQVRIQFPNQNDEVDLRLGESFREECVACLLGGFGIPAEVGLLAFKKLKRSNMLKSQKVSFEDVFAVLSCPLTFENGRQVRYRFAKQKSQFIANFLTTFCRLPRSKTPRETRDWLTKFDGFGLKTASWVVRNWFGADDVAILDIHIHRAGLLAGFLSPSHKLPRDYLVMEERFLKFSDKLGVRPAFLDATIWLQMRHAPRLVDRCISR